MPNLLCFFGIYLPKDYSSFAQQDHFIHSKLFCRIVQFTKFVVQCQKSFVFSKVCRSLGRHDSEGFYCFQNEGIEECGRSDRVLLLLNKMRCSTAHLWTNNLLGYDAGHTHLNYKSKKCVHFFDGNIRWLR